MAEASRDQNRVTSLLGVSSSGFVTPTTVAVNPLSHAMLVEGSFTPPDLQNVNLTQVGGVAFALGQQLATASLPVVLTAAQISTLTPLSTVAVTQSTSPWIVAGGGTAGTAATGVVSVQGIASMTPVQVSQATASNLNATVVQATGTNLHTVIDSGTITTVTNLSQQGGVAISLNTGVRDTGTQRVTIATNDLVPISIASGQVASGAIASGAVASGAVASGAFASGSIASGAIAAGAIAAGATSIADNEDVASADGDRLVKVAQVRQDTPVANAGVNADGDYLNFKADNFGKTWVTGTAPEDVAHVAGEALTITSSRRIDTLATSAGSSGDWATVNQTAEGGAWASLAATATPNGLLVGNFTSGDTYTALTNTAQAIKASAGNLYGYYIYNPNATAAYVEIYNIAQASVTVGTSTATLVFCIPATSAANLMFPVPIPFSNTGWSIAATTTGGGNTAPGTALECMVFYL